MVVPDGSEDIGTTGTADLNPMAVVNLAIARFLVRINIAQLAVEVHI